MEVDQEILEHPGFPELTGLGKHIEMLRIDRRLSKQHLARHVGTSRQQLWRVMTGKSELTPTLRARLADVLAVDTFELGAMRSAPSAASRVGPPRATDADLLRYLNDPIAVKSTLATMPSGDRGRALKRGYLDALEDLALEAGVALHHELFDLRRKVLAGDL